MRATSQDPGVTSQDLKVGGVVLLFILGSSLGGVGPVRGLRGEEEGGGVRSGPGAARTILLYHPTFSYHLWAP
jgi:hypothetical protein